MAVAETEQLVVQLEARIDQFEKSFQRASRTANDNWNRIESRSRQASTRLQNEMAKASKAVGGIVNTRPIIASLTALTGALGVREIIKYADAWKVAQNDLKVAGVTGSHVATVLQQLYELAQKNASPLEATVKLYSRASQAAENLGASQADILKATDAVGLALKVSGQTAEQASGALLQLSQLFQGPKVQAQEYNSLIDGLYPLLQAVAAGSTKWGGSVAKLTQDVKASKVATKDFFDALLKGLPSLQERASTATETVAQGFTKVHNAMVRYVGSTDSSLSATQRLVKGLDALADNFDHVADTTLKVASVLAGALIGRSIAGMLAKLPAAATAVMGLVAALRAGAGAAAAFEVAAGPIGLLIGGLAAGVAILAMRQTDSERAADAHRKALLDLDRALTDVQAGVPGAKAKLEELSAAHIKAAKAALADAKAQLAALEAAENYKAKPGDSFMSRFFGQIGSDAMNQPATQKIADAERKKLKQAIADRERELNELTTTINNPPSTGSGHKPGGVGGTGKKGKENDYQREVQQIKNRTEALQNEASTVGKSTAEIEKAKAALELEQAAKKAGIPITATLRSQIDQLATAYGQAAEHAKDMHRAEADAIARMDEFRSSAKDVLSGFVRDLRDGKTGAQALADALGNIENKLLDVAENKLIAGLFGETGKAGGGLFGGLLGGLLGGIGKADGGYVSGPGTGRSDSIPARLSNGEFVVKASATAQHRQLLEAINSGYVGRFANGGLVSAPTMPSAPKIASIGGSTTVLNAPISIEVHGSAGTPQQNAELADMIGKQVHEAIRTTATKELRAQMRPGGMLYG